MKLALIGDGLAARSLAYYLKPHLGSKLELIQISSQKFAPACSFTSTAVSAKRGVEKGVSTLGDTLFEGHEFLEKFVNENEPKGVEQSTHFQLWSIDHEKEKDFSRRFSPAKKIQSSELPFAINKELKGRAENCFVFYPQDFLCWLTQDANWQRIDDYVLELEETKNCKAIIHTQKKQSLEVDAVINTGSIYSSFIDSFSRHDQKLERSQPVAGSYWQATCELGEKSWSLSFDGVNVVYRALDKTIQIGSHSQKNTVLICDSEKTLVNFYLKIKSCFGFSLPAFESGEVYTGLRQKGVKRQSFWGRLDHSNFPFYALHSLYKSGFTLSMYQASQLAQLILNNHQLIGK